MFRKNYFTFLLAIALFSIVNITAYAQAGLARGRVDLKKADGTVTPLEGVTIDVYRTDVKGKLPSAETNKKGEFTILGLVPGGRYALSVSAPNVRADVFPEIKAGDEKVMITVIEGDGKISVYRNWFQDYTPETIRAELTAGGFEVESLWGDLTGAPLEEDSEWIGVVARKKE